VTAGVTDDVALVRVVAVSIAVCYIKVVEIVLLIIGFNNTATPMVSQVHNQRQTPIEGCKRHGRNIVSLQTGPKLSNNDGELVTALKNAYAIVIRNKPV